MTEAEREEEYKKLTWAAIQLLLNVGLISTIIGRTPQEVQDNFVEKMQVVTRELEREIVEFQDFGEAFDA